MNQNIPIERHGEMIICFTAEPEEYDMKKHFMKDCGYSLERFRKIEHFQWFCAKVSVWLNGRELTAEYIGSCCYEDPMEFVRESDYYPEMKRDALAKALKALQN